MLCVDLPSNPIGGFHTLTRESAALSCKKPPGAQRKTSRRGMGCTGPTASLSLPPDGAQTAKSCKCTFPGVQLNPGCTWTLAALLLQHRHWGKRTEPVTRSGWSLLPLITFGTFLLLCCTSESYMQKEAFHVLWPITFCARVGQYLLYLWIRFWGDGGQPPA